MNLIGLHELHDVNNSEASWVVPASLSANHLQNALYLVNKFESSPLVFDDGQEAADFIQLKSVSSRSRMKTMFENENDESLSDDQPLFEPGGPTRKKSDTVDTSRKRKRERNFDETDDSDDHQLSVEQLEKRNLLRRKRELEKRRKIKSELYVRDSDDESNDERDAEFFEREEMIRQRNRDLQSNVS